MAPHRLVYHIAQFIIMSLYTTRYNSCSLSLTGCQTTFDQRYVQFHDKMAQTTLSTGHHCTVQPSPNSGIAGFDHEHLFFHDLVTLLTKISCIYNKALRTV